MENYMGCKMVKAEPAYNVDGKIYTMNEPVPRAMSRKEGYKVVYVDGYESWSPKEVFEKAYMKVGDKNTITEELIDSFIKDVQVIASGKSVITKVTLVNGFEMFESSSCVDPQNFNVEIGKENCLKKVKSRLWELLGFMLQTAINGVKEK